MRRYLTRAAAAAALSILMAFPAAAQVRAGARDTVRLVEQKLVELALQSPRYDAANHQNVINELELRKTKNAWLNLLAVSLNYNDQTFRKADPGTPQNFVYPKYLLGVTVPLGIIFSRNVEIKQAREAIDLSKKNQEQLARELKAQVLGLYRQWRAYNELVALQGVMINDVQAALVQTEEKFIKGSITMEPYHAAQKIYNDEIAERINLQSERDLIRFQIEELIGVPLEDVIRTALQ